MKCQWTRKCPRCCRQYWQKERCAVNTTASAAVASRSTSTQTSPPYAICTSGGSRIYTATSAVPNVACMVVQDGKVAGLGSVADMRHRFGSDLPVHTLHSDHTVLPGLADAHAHLLDYGHSRTLVDLAGAVSVKGQATRCGSRWWQA